MTNYEKVQFQNQSLKNSHACVPLSLYAGGTNHNHILSCILLQCTYCAFMMASSAVTMDQINIKKPQTLNVVFTVFHRVYRLEIQPAMLEFSTLLSSELAPLLSPQATRTFSPYILP
jgi:hypothetical protein